MNYKLNPELNPDPTTLDTLDITVLKGLEFLAESKANGGIPDFDETPAARFKMPLAIGSGLSENNLEILYDGQPVVVANETNYKAKFETWQSTGLIDGIVLLSISGGKHSPTIASWASEQGLDTVLLTCNPQTPVLDDPNITGVVFPSPSRHAENQDINPYSDPEPLTYNFATYTGMMMSKTGEDPSVALNWIKDVVDPIIDEFNSEGKTLGEYSSFMGLVPPKLSLLPIRGVVKFQEMMGQVYGVDVFTPEDTKHAKTVVPGENELYFNIGVDNSPYGDSKDQLNIPLPEGAGYATATAVLYYAIGKIQAALPQHYKENVSNYAKEQGVLFDKPPMNLLQDYHMPKE